MKPLMLIHLPDGLSDETCKKINDEMLKSEKFDFLKNYDVLMYSSASIQVIHFNKPQTSIKYFYHKFKIWLILKILKNKLS